jgi:hypothetical protein
MTLRLPTVDAQGVSKKPLWKFNLLSCTISILNNSIFTAKQFNRTKELLFSFFMIPFLNRNDTEEMAT